MIPARCGRGEALAWCVATVAALAIVAASAPMLCAAWLAARARGAVRGSYAASRRRGGNR